MCIKAKLKVLTVTLILVNLLGSINVKAEGSVTYEVNWWGDCWYYDPPNPYPIQGAQYYYDSFIHTSTDGTSRYFYPLTLWYSGVNCTDERPYGFANSQDGWSMEVDTPNKIKVWNDTGQLVYCHNYTDITQSCY
jgi:hypothetical protein